MTHAGAAAGRSQRHTRDERRACGLQEARERERERGRERRRGRKKREREMKRQRESGALTLSPANDVSV